MTFPLMDRTRRLTEEALERGRARPGSGSTASCSSAARRGCRWSGRTSREMAGQAAEGGRERRRGRRPRRGDPGGDRGRAETRRADADARGSRSPGPRRVTDVMSHSLGAVAVSPDGSAYVNDVVIRRNLPIPAENTKSYLHATHGGANDRLEVYLTQGESARAARLHDPRQVRLLGHPADRRRGDGRRRHVVRRQRRRPGPGRPARHGARAGR